MLIIILFFIFLSYTIQLLTHTLVNNFHKMSIILKHISLKENILFSLRTFPYLRSNYILLPLCVIRNTQNLPHGGKQKNRSREAEMRDNLQNLNDLNEFLILINTISYPCAYAVKIARKDVCNTFFQNTSGMNNFCVLYVCFVYF